MIDTSIFEHKVRVRACGILIENDRILLLRHNSFGKKGFLWSPPGGGVDFNENTRQTLMKEFDEETGLQIEVGQFLFVNEYRSDKHHALELFFEVHRISGQVKLGYDPELPPDGQVLADFHWFSLSELHQLAPENLHNRLQHLEQLQEIIFLRGFFIFEDISIK